MGHYGTSNSGPSGNQFRLISDMGESLWDKNVVDQSVRGIRRDNVGFANEVISDKSRISLKVDPWLHPHMV